MYILASLLVMVHCTRLICSTYTLIKEFYPHYQRITDGNVTGVLEIDHASWYIDSESPYPYHRTFRVMSSFQAYILAPLGLILICSNHYTWWSNLKAEYVLH